VNESVSQETLIFVAMILKIPSRSHLIKFKFWFHTSKQILRGNFM